MLLTALLVTLQSVEFDVAQPFEHCMQIGRAVCVYGDWDRDGHADFLISAPTAIFDSTPTVALVSGRDGTGLLVLRGDEKTTGWWFGSSLATRPDIDGDARPEIVARVEAGVAVFASADGKRLYELADVLPCLVDDADGDGHGDWLVRSKSSKGREQLAIASGKTGAPLRVLVEDRRAHTDAALLHARNASASVALLSFFAQSATVEVLSTSTGEPRASRSFEVDAQRPEGHLCTIGDLDGDGVTDIVLSTFDDTVNSAMGSKGWPPGAVLVLSGRDLSTIRELTVSDKVARFGYSIDSGADVDTDGVEDVLITEYGDLFAATHQRALLLSGANGKLIHKQDASESFGCVGRFVGDADGDGTADYAVSDVYVLDTTTTEPGGVTLFSGKTGAVLRTFGR